MPERRHMSRFVAGAMVVACLATTGAARGAEARLENGTAWYTIPDTAIEGKGWSDTKRPFDRLPGKAEGVVRDPVWGLSRHSAGLAFRFRSNATAIYARYTLLSDAVAMPHMPATGVSGLDLYALTEHGTWNWVGVTRPSAQDVEGELASDLSPGMREYLVYLPLYNGVEKLELGVATDDSFELLPPRTLKPIVFYGTSILHGACASRPGMAFPAILGRRLDRPVINLGFSGNGRMEPEVAELLAEIPAAAFVVDCLPNMNAPEIAKRAEPLVRRIRTAQPDTPIVLVEDRTYANAIFKPASQQRHATSRAALRNAYDRLVADGVTGLRYVEGEQLLGPDGEATVDSSHPSDLGMWRQADVLEPILRPLCADR